MLQRFYVIMQTVVYTIHLTNIKYSPTQFKEMTLYILSFPFHSIKPFKLFFSASCIHEKHYSSRSFLKLYGITWLGSCILSNATKSSFWLTASMSSTVQEMSVTNHLLNLISIYYNITHCCFQTQLHQPCEFITIPRFVYWNKDHQIAHTPAMHKSWDFVQ